MIIFCSDCGYRTYTVAQAISRWDVNTSTPQYGKQATPERKGD